MYSVCDNYSTYSVNVLLKPKQMFVPRYCTHAHCGLIVLFDLL